MEIEVYYPYVEVEIITEKENLVLRGQYEPNAIDTSNMVSDVVSLITKRDIGADCPTFSINLVYRNDWFTKLASNDMIIISVCRPPEKNAAVMFGLIDDIRRSRVIANGKPMRTVAVTGRGFNKALINFEVGAVKEANVSESALGFIFKEFSLSTLSAAEAIRTVLGYYVEKYINYNFGSAGSYTTFTEWLFSSRPDEGLTDTTGLMEYQGSLWNLLKELQNAPFNEMYWEVLENKPTFYVRETPFNEQNWNSLNKSVLVDKDIVEDNTGKSDLETYTLYSVSCRTYMSSIDEAGTLGCLPLWYEPYFPKYGIKRLQVSSLYAMYANKSDTQTASEDVSSYMKDLYNWNIKNNSMQNGTITVKGSNKYKVGERLETPEGYEFYVESVTHSFTIYDSFTTQLGVTRGLKPEDRFTTPWGSATEFTPDCTPNT